MSESVAHTGAPEHTVTHAGDHGSLKSYVIGFTLSLVLTFSSYLLVSKHALSSTALLISVLVLAVTQFIVQLLFFLHVANERKPRFNLLTFVAMIVVVVLVVFLSLWIMKNLNYHLNMNGHNAEQNIVKDEGIKSNSMGGMNMQNMDMSHQGAHH